MKIRANRKSLADALAWVSQALAKGHAIPSLSGIHLSASEGTLTMRAFDHHVGHTAQLAVDVINDGEALVSGRFLATVIGGLRDAEVELVLDGRDLIIRSGRSTYRTRLMLVGDYPALPAFPTRVGIIDADNAVPIKTDVTNNEWIEWARPIWLDIRESNTLNVKVAREDADERHICPLQLDFIERCVRLWSNPGELVFTPFAGIGSEVYVARQQGRRGLGIELKPSYWSTAVANLRRLDDDRSHSSVLDTLEPADA